MMQEWQQRVVNEYNELQIKYAKLENFRSSDAIEKLDTVDTDLLQRQSFAMHEYLHILKARISRF